MSKIFPSRRSLRSMTPVQETTPQHAPPERMSRSSLTGGTCGIGTLPFEVSAWINSISSGRLWPSLTLWD